MKLVKENIEHFKRGKIKDTLRIGRRYNFEIGDQFEVLGELEWNREKNEWISLPGRSKYLSGRIKIGTILTIKKINGSDISLKPSSHPHSFIHLEKEKLENINNFRKI